VRRVARREQPLSWRLATGLLVGAAGAVGLPRACIRTALINEISKVRAAEVMLLGVFPCMASSDLVWAHDRCSPLRSWAF